jgi:hypothetical protein
MAHKYSDGERLLLKILSEQTSPITTVRLSELYYDQRPGPAPLFGRNSVLSTLKTLNKKVQLNREKFKITMTQNRGPVPLEIQLKGKLYKAELA